MIPDQVWSHIGAWFLGASTILGIGWFASLTNRVKFLEEENEALKEVIVELHKRVGVE